ncbi:cysteine-rich receptor-like protein kinase 8 [Tanacetum coccineum]
MNPLPTVAKAYSMIKQEEKQREGFTSKIPVTTALSAHSNSYRSSYNNNARGGRNYSQGESLMRGSSNNYYQVRREPPNNTSHENDAAMCATMDQLQKQPNQMMLMMQNNKEMTGTQSFSVAGTHLPLSILFTPFSCYFQDHHKRIARGSLYNGLYIIRQEPTTSPSTILSITNNNVALWHSRLGHPSFKVLQQIKSLSTSHNCNFHVCNVCPLAKQNALPFLISESLATTLFDLIHVDIWGPYKHSTDNQCK